MNIFNNVLPYIGIQWLGELVVLQNQLLLIPILLATERSSYPLIIFINYPVAAFSPVSSVNSARFYHQIEI